MYLVCAGVEGRGDDEQDRAGEDPEEQRVVGHGPPHSLVQHRVQGANLPPPARLRGTPGGRGEGGGYAATREAKADLQKKLMHLPIQFPIQSPGESPDQSPGQR